MHPYACHNATAGEHLHVSEPFVAPYLIPPTAPIWYATVQNSTKWNKKVTKTTQKQGE
ncbi:MAG: hypothetical protein AAF528_06290 [Cyanobacteria bacterium P01_C01_bin.121]